MNLGLAIKTMRKQKGINQGVCAVRMAITQSYLSQIENNKKTPSIDVLVDASLVLGIPLPVLMWSSIELQDIPEYKRAMFKMIKPSFDALLTNVFFDIK